MNFLISEDEYNRLHAVQRQLNMMSRLFGGMKGWETQCDPEDLAEFFCGQESTLGDVRKAITNRWELANTVEKPMRWMDWLTVMEVASGDYAPLHPNAVKYIDDALSKMAAVEPEYELVVKKWTEVSSQRAQQERKAKQSIIECMSHAEPSGHVSVALFADLLRAVSGQAMELDELNETVRQFEAAFDEKPADWAVIVKAISHALMHNGYQHSTTMSQSGHHSAWVRKAGATGQAMDTAPTVGKQRKRERTAKKAKGTAPVAQGAMT